MMKTGWLLPLLLYVAGHPAAAEDVSVRPPNVPRIASVVMAAPQPHATDHAVIWYDDFDDPQRQRQYPEQSGELTAAEHFGAGGRSLEMFYARGQRGTGGRKIFFGDSPTHRRQRLRSGESFDEIYWRIYLKHPTDWRGGGPAKLSRATSLVPPGWRQAMIAHVWSSGEALTLDPATGVRDGQVVTTRYNDFPNLRWLGNKPASNFALHGADGRGWWVCVEARVKLNTPGQQDGLNQLCIDGRLEAERRGLDWRGTYQDYGINAIFLEAYWNEGSPVDQSRWIDNFVVSTQPIGPVVCDPYPELLKTPYAGPADQQAWQVEVAADDRGASVVWHSGEIRTPRKVRVDTHNGVFTGALSSRTQLAPGGTYYCRVRQQSNQGAWSAWSPWHQPLRTSDRSQNGR